MAPQMSIRGKKATIPKNNKLDHQVSLNRPVINPPLNK